MKTVPRGAYLCVLDVVKKAVAETWGSRESEVLPTTMFHADLAFSGVDLLKLVQVIEDGELGVAFKDEDFRPLIPLYLTVADDRSVDWFVRLILGKLGYL